MSKSDIGRMLKELKDMYNVLKEDQDSKNLHYLKIIFIQKINLMILKTHSKG